MLKIKDSPISRKLTWMNMLVSGTALLLACVAFVAYDLASFRQATVRNLSIQAQIIGANSVSALLFNDPQSAENTLSALNVSPYIRAAGIYTLGKQPFASFRRADARPIPRNIPDLTNQPEIYWVEGSRIILLRAIVFEGKPIGFVFLRSDMEEIHQRLHRYLIIAGIVLLVSMIAALLVSLVFKRAVAAPIIHLAQVAQTVTHDQNYSVRATPAPNRGELTVLIDSFNDMIAQIQQRDTALQQAHDELEKRVEERTAQLAVANKELEAFSYSVSHDLRSPLRGIDGFSQALLEDYAEKLDATGRDYLHRVRTATQRMSVLIDDLLNLARVTRSTMQWEDVDLTSMAKSVAEELKKDRSRTGVEFLITEGLKTRGDSRLLRVVLDNLLGNAWKYTSNHAQARIEFGSAERNGTTAYFVRDDGAGFDPRYAARLFGAFQRLHTANEFPGSGIGLATVQRIIHRHGGEVSAEGDVEKGAVFYFTLSSSAWETNERTQH